TGQPASATKCVGQSATFAVTATGAGLTYQWRRNGANIAGATSSSYTISSVSLGDAGSYDVVVTNSCSSITSTAATLTVNAPPSVTVNSPAICSGSSATLNATVSG